jgi:predicted AlkP superfamily pyrophosphatase or phosphodiesterase
MRPKDFSANTFLFQKFLLGLMGLIGLMGLMGLTGCAGGPGPAPHSPEAAPDSPEAQNSAEILILVSLDGFRWDYMEAAATPTLDRLATGGVRAERLIPSFPSKTFPNHYTLVTGLRPAEHGIVANHFYDPVFDARFTIGDPTTVTDARWWGGEPIWVTAERQGRRAATLFWPGSEAAIGGVLPSYGLPYDHDLPHADRVATLLQWLDAPADRRPTFLTLYLSDVDSAGHAYGPGAPETLAAIEKVDATLGTLLAGLERRNLARQTHWIIVADHGMAATARERVILFDDFVSLEQANAVDVDPLLALWPAEEDREAVYRALAGAHPHLQVYRRAEIPERFQYRDHRRIPPILGVADEGWSIASRADFERHPERYDGGAHGYDPALPSMGALFIGHGPKFRQGATVPPLENLHVYELMCHILGLEPATNSGHFSAVRHLLREESSTQ